MKKKTPVLLRTTKAIKECERIINFRMCGTEGIVHEEHIVFETNLYCYF
jgi:hypothetical protein